MFSATWRRPANIIFPQVWRRFERTGKDGKVQKFKIQDITDDMYEEIIDFMTVYYAPEEPWNSASGLHQDPESLKIFQDHVREDCFPQRVAVVCLPDDRPIRGPDGKLDVVGCNLGGVCTKNEPDNFAKLMKTKQITDLLTMHHALKQNHPNLYEKYGVDCFMNSLGICVHPKYRGNYIALDMFLTREVIGKAVGVPMTTACLSAPGSYKAAVKANFKFEGSITFAELAEITGCTFNNIRNETTLMSKVWK